jgi:predicted porin
MFTTSKNLQIFALATVAFALPAAAHAEAFKRDGVSYEYTSSVENGYTVLTGTADKVPFRFVVRGRYVTGEYNYRPVSFTRPATKQVRATVAVR